MAFEVMHMNGTETILVKHTWYDERGVKHKAGLIIEMSPNDLPEVTEGEEYPRMFLTKDAANNLRV